MLKVDAVAEVVWNFLQAGMKTCFADTPDGSVEPAAALKVFALLENLEFLSGQEIADLGAQERVCLKLLLMQYCQFFIMFTDLWFPDDFLDGSSRSQLGKPLLRYMAEHRWPFPQMLK